MFELHQSWRDALGWQAAAASLARPERFLARQSDAFCPHPTDVLRAFELTPFSQVKVVILGSEPYPHLERGRCVADGLAFSTRPGSSQPPSLRNIFAAIAADLGRPPSVSASLDPWAREGVLLLNTVLTVAADRPDSHRCIGWEGFTELCLEALSAEREQVVFLLWGEDAQRREKLIDTSRHPPPLKASHPAARGRANTLLACTHFSQANALVSPPPISW